MWMPNWGAASQVLSGAIITLRVIKGVVSDLVKDRFQRLFKKP